MKNIKLIYFFNIILLLLLIIVVKIIQFPDTEKPSSEESVKAEDNNEDDDWAFFLINSQNPLPANYTPVLETVYKGDKDYQLDQRCAGKAIEMIEAAKKDGITLVVCSAYRSVEKQEENFNDYIDYLIKKGYSREQAVKSAKSQIASPGESEHNAGLALDIVTENWFDTHSEVDEDFENTVEFEWLIENSYKYGFIMRYPKGMENITGFIYEPWHYRYIGLEHAEQIYYMGLTLEEYYMRISF